MRADRIAQPPVDARRRTVVLLLSVLLAAVAACGTAPPPGPAGGAPLRLEIGFGFDIVNLQTDHQFPGQRSTFHVTYRYRDGLQGAGYDPAGHPVAGDTYPYFQDVRDDLMELVRTYPDKSDFYEVFLDTVARELMSRYPQLAWIDLRVDVPAFGGVPTTRTGSVRVSR